MDKNNYCDDSSWVRPTTCPPKGVLIVGAGIGGLTTAIALHRSGHHVRIVEQASVMSEVGAGIQLPPNATRILARLGVLEKILEKTNFLSHNSLRRYANNEELTTAKLMPKVGEKFGSPSGVIHRGDLQTILLDTVQALHIPLLLNHKVTQIDHGVNPRLRAAGKWLQADVIIAADGIKSLAREEIVTACGRRDSTDATGDAAYRIVIPRERFAHDLRALEYLEQNVGMRWMGPGGHVMAYPIKPCMENGTEINTLYNMVLLHPSKPEQEETSAHDSWTSRGSKREMLDFYAAWNPDMLNLLSYVHEDEVMEWTLKMHKPLSTWVEGHVALLGDACHPMLPYVAQGAAQAIEDAGVLMECLSLTSDISLALRVYELVRKERAERIQRSSSDMSSVLHLPDGAEQQERDQRMRESSRTGSNPDQWADASWQEFMYRVDVMEETRLHWQDWVAQVQARAPRPIHPQRQISYHFGYGAKAGAGLHSVSLLALARLRRAYMRMVQKCRSLSVTLAR